MSPYEELDRFLRLGARLENCRHERVGDMLGTVFELQSETEFYGLYHAAGREEIASFELREPRRGASFRGLLIAHLVTGKVGLDTLVERMGNPEPQSVDPMPRATPPRLGMFFALGRNRLGVTSIDAQGKPVESLAIHCL
ncbi:MAG: hypothetical protein D6754_06480 [Alphaproteobacteria bacterium]|nr:MAG: hypothetical protein D6754_06480 [Alphaproteobacteria bacterium]